MEKEELEKNIGKELDKIFGDRRKGLCLLTESCINRMFKQGENGMIIISGNRSNIESSDPNISLEDEYSDYLSKNELEDSDKLADQWLENRNKSADNELKKILSHSKFSYSQLYGGYHGQDGVADDFEPLFIVYSRDKMGRVILFDELLDLGLKLCNKFKQASFYVQKPGEVPIYMNYNGDNANSRESKKFKINRDAMFYTTAKRDKSNPKKLTVDIMIENRVYCAVRPSTYTEKIMRAGRGEYFLDY